MTLRQIRDCEGQRRWQLDTNFIGRKKHMCNTCVPQATLGTVSFLFFPFFFFVFLVCVCVNSAQFLQYMTCPHIDCERLTWARCQTQPKAALSLSLQGPLANVFQLGVLSPWGHRSCLPGACSSHDLPIESWPPLGIWYGILPKLQVDLCSPMDPCGLQGSACSTRQGWNMAGVSGVTGLEHGPAQPQRLPKTGSTVPPSPPPAAWTLDTSFSPVPRSRVIL